MSSTSVTPFRNRDNFAKYLLLHFEPGSNVLLLIFRWLYNGRQPPEQHLLSLFKEKLNNFTKRDKSALEKIKSADLQIHQLDFSLLFCIIKVSCGLAPLNDPIWSRTCSINQKGDLEHLIFNLKESRNDVAHPSDEQKNLTDLHVEKKAKEISSLLESIIKQAGLKAGISQLEIDDQIKLMADNINTICSDMDSDSKMKPIVYQLIKQDIKDSYENDLKTSFDNELKGYSKPSLSAKQTQSENKDNVRRSVNFSNQPLDEILILFQHYDIITVDGKSGDGKTSMVKYIFKCWLTNEPDGLKNLMNFDIVFMIQCRRINTRSISEFLESELPTASFYFSNTSSLQRQLKKSKVLYLIDGYDECTVEAKGFFKEVLESLSTTHKLLVTKRTFFAEVLNTNNRGIEVEILPLEDENIDDILNKLVKEEQPRGEIRKNYMNLCRSLSSEHIRKPLSLNLFIAAWSQESKSFDKISSEIHLFKLDLQQKLKHLKNRLENKTSLSSSELDDKILFWFRFLCFQSYKLVHRGVFGIVDETAEYELKNHPTMQFLVFSDCLSTFLLASNLRGTRQLGFSHMLQQYYYASLFLKHVFQCKKSSTPVDPLFVKFLSAQDTFDRHYIEIVKCLIDELKHDCTLSFNADIVTEAMQHYVKHTTRTTQQILMDMIECANFDDNVALHFGKAFKDGSWVLTEKHLKPAVCLLRFHQPRKVHIFADAAMADHKEQFKSLLTTLTKYPIVGVSLNFSIYGVVDSFLPKIDANNKLRLITFRGFLQDLSFLEMNYEFLQQLRIRIKTIEGYNSCVFIVTRAKHLEHFRLTIDFDLGSNIQLMKSIPPKSNSKTVLAFLRYEHTQFEKVRACIDRMTKRKLSSIIKKPLKRIELLLSDHSVLDNKQTGEVIESLKKYAKEVIVVKDSISTVQFLKAL